MGQCSSDSSFAPSARRHERSSLRADTTCEAGSHGVSTGAERLNLDEKTIGDTFKAAGYATGAFGKWHNGTQYPYHPNARGFDEYYGFCSGHWGQYFDPILEHNGKIVRGKGFIIDDLTDHALAFIERNRDRPLLFAICPIIPHIHPSRCPTASMLGSRTVPFRCATRDPEKEELDKTRCVLAMCENIDWNVGRVLDKLDELGLAEDTLVVYFSDNGPNSWRWNGGNEGTQGFDGRGGPARPHADSDGPGGSGRARESSRSPGPSTCCQRWRMWRTSQWSVTSHWTESASKPLLLGQARDWPDRMLFSHQNGRVSVRTQRYRLDAKGHLYDMVTDPGQDHDVSQEHPEIAAKLAEAVAR